MDDESRPGRPRSRRRFLAALGTAATVGVAGCTDATAPASDAATGTTQDPENQDTPGSGTAPGSENGSLQDGTESPYTRVYEQTIDSVVLIRVSGEGDQQGGQGSGFVYDENHAVTNQHVVDGVDTADVRFARGDWREGEVVGTDAYSDLAVVRIEDMPDYAGPLELVEEPQPVGTEVVALGNPFGFAESVSSGIVSGRNRSLPGPNNYSIADAVQTDAAVNPGNSGGPLVRLDGKVVGVINSGGGQNIGFAISAALMKRVVPALIEDGEFEHTLMGIRLVEVTPEIARANDLSKIKGVLVVEVVEDSPSDGVLQGSPDETDDRPPIPVGGDVIVGIDGQEIQSQDDLSRYLALNTDPGDTVSLEVIRDGERTTVELTLGSRPPP